METFVANIAAAKIQRRTLGGKTYLVAPLSLIVPGVLNGSKGALFYSADEIARNVSQWNDTPLVVYHPVVDGKNVSAKHPGVIQRSGVGLIKNARVTKTGRLVAEGWFEEASTKRVDSRVYTSLVQGTPIELSTGLFTDNEAAPFGSNHNGKMYDFVAKNYVPDHLAILPDQVGACSLNDGCGVLVNKETQMTEPTDNEKTTLWQRLGELLGLTNNENKGMIMFEPTGNGGPGSGPHPGYTHGTIVAAHAAVATAKAVSAKTFRKGGGERFGTGSNKGIVKDAGRYSSHAQKVSAKANDAKSHQAAAKAHMVASAYHSAAASNLRDADYGSGKQSAEAHSVAAKAHTEAAWHHHSMSGAKLGSSIAMNKEKEELMLTANQRTMVINALVENCDCPDQVYNEEDRPVLDKLTDTALVELLTANAKANKSSGASGDPADPAIKEQDTKAKDYGSKQKKPKGQDKDKDLSPSGEDKDEDVDDVDVEPKRPSTNTETTMADITKEAALAVLKGLTEDEFMSIAPASIRETVTNSQNLINKQKADLILQLTANTKDEAVKTRQIATFQDMKVEQLQDILAAIPQVQTNNQIRSVASYLGAAGATLNQQAPVRNKEKEAEMIKAMTPPRIDFAAESKALANNRRN